MKLFQCQHCGQPLYFENTRCESCGHELGYLPSREAITALEPDGGDQWRALADPEGRYRFCDNRQYDVCNWLVPAETPDRYCPACRHNRTIPDLSQPNNLLRWRKMELAKHRLFYSLLRFRLPLVTRAEDPWEGLAFDFLSDGPVPVLTGHENGIITINLVEADDAERERRRTQMGEPYRTLLGHFRHEIAHYYWDRLVAGSPSLDACRTIFGDDRKDYAAALKDHYSKGPPADWAQHFITPYATAHPWEDWAETWAHYFHMVDTLETASAFGLHIKPRLSKGAAALSADINFDPYVATIDHLIENWLPLTFAVNSINRSMGISDLYPFVLAPAVISKLSFVHDMIDARQHRQQSGALRAMVAGLKRKVGAPTRP